MPRTSFRILVPSFATRMAVAAACMVSACASHPTPEPARRGHPPALSTVDFVQFRWEDTVSRSSVRFIDPASGQPVSLDDSVVLDIRGIDSAWARHARSDSTHWEVDLLLSRSGAAQFGATTATHVGRRLAIVVDGAITQMPIIQSALGPRVPLVSHVQRPVADSLAARVNRAVEALRPFQPVALPRDVTRQGARNP